MARVVIQRPLLRVFLPERRKVDSPKPLPLAGSRSEPSLVGSLPGRSMVYSPLGQSMAGSRPGRLMVASQRFRLKAVIPYPPFQSVSRRNPSLGIPPRLWPRSAVSGSGRASIVVVLTGCRSARCSDQHFGSDRRFGLRFGLRCD